MGSRRSSLFFAVQVALAILVLVGLGWANYRYSQGNLIAHDFLTKWASERVYATQGFQPYTTQAWEAGARLLPGIHTGSGPFFANPFYSLFIILPFALVPDPILAQAFWLLVLELAIALLLVASLSTMQWKPKLLSWLPLLLFSFFGLHSILALQMGSLGIVAALFGVSAVAALRTERDELAGLALAMASIQPEMMLLFIVFVLFWTISRRRGKVILWFISGVAVLSVLGMFFIIDWPVQYIRVLVKYSDQIQFVTPSAAFMSWWKGIGRQLGWGLNAFAAAILIVEWFWARGKDYRWFLWTACLTIVLGQWVGIPTNIDYFVLMLFPVVVILGTIDQRLERDARWFTPGALIVILVGFWILYSRFYSGFSPQEIQYSLLFPQPFVLLLGLYWVRWWCVRPQRLIVDDLKAYEAHQ